jgi:hypothetical protein
MQEVFMSVSRRDFLKLTGSLLGGWIVTIPEPGTIGKFAGILDQLSDPNRQGDGLGAENPDELVDSGDYCIPNSSTRINSEQEICNQQKPAAASPEDERILGKIGYFNDISPEDFVFDENKYSPLQRELAPSDWSATTRHLPIEIDPEVINRPGERDPQALRAVVAYTTFDTPRYVAARGERITMCNIAAWDWSRALQVHLPHWIGETEMSANMLYRWISHKQAGGIYGEGWQPVNMKAAKLLANRGVPVFALAQNTNPGRHGHVALVYPKSPPEGEKQMDGGFYLASVNNGRSSGGNGIKSLERTFRWLKPTYFVHKNDFIVYQDS